MCCVSVVRGSDLTTQGVIFAALCCSLCYARADPCVLSFLNGIGAFLVVKQAALQRSYVGAWLCQVLHNQNDSRCSLCDHCERLFSVFS